MKILRVACGESFYVVCFVTMPVETKYFSWESRIILFRQQMTKYVCRNAIRKYIITQSISRSDIVELSKLISWWEDSSRACDIRDGLQLIHNQEKQSRRAITVGGVRGLAITIHCTTLILPSWVHSNNWEAGTLDAEALREDMKILTADNCCFGNSFLACKLQ